MLLASTISRAKQKRRAPWFLLLFAVATIWLHPRLIANDWCLIHNHSDLEHHHDGSLERGDDLASGNESDHSEKDSDCFHTVAHWHSLTTRDIDTFVDLDFMREAPMPIRPISAELKQKNRPISKYYSDQSIVFIKTIVLIV